MIVVDMVANKAINRYIHRAVFIALIMLGVFLVTAIAIDVADIHAPLIPCRTLNSMSNGNDGVIAYRKDDKENIAKP